MRFLNYKVSVAVLLYSKLHFQGLLFEAVVQWLAQLPHSKKVLGHRWVALIGAHWLRSIATCSDALISDVLPVSLSLTTDNSHQAACAIGLQSKVFAQSLRVLDNEPLADQLVTVNISHWL